MVRGQKNWKFNISIGAKIRNDWDLGMDLKKHSNVRKALLRWLMLVESTVYSVQVEAGMVRHRKEQS